MRIPDRGSTTGEARWTDHERSEWAARRASKASQSPRCTHRQQSQCLMAAAPYQAYVIVPPQPSNKLCSVGRISVSAIRHFYPCKSRHFRHQSTPLLTP
ncbi:hypothetical protein BFG07_11265 [Kosakonia cowanii]|nr:hypothetical protein BFG07_11265 [Kosakonia cowanii]